jgi:SAM-dependent methyltransferase
MNEKEHPLPSLPEEAFRRYDEAPDEGFYLLPRFVTHIDDRAIAAVTQLYREFFPPGGEILDLMSSWVSHLPPEVTYSRVIGLGMNEAELRRNERLDAYVVHNLNRTPELPFGDAEFDGCGICVSIDYLTRPVEVLREVGQVLKVGAPVVITFSNRCFPTKAVAELRALQRDFASGLANGSEVHRVLGTTLIPAVVRIRACRQGLFAGQASFGAKTAQGTSTRGLASNRSGSRFTPWRMMPSDGGSGPHPTRSISRVRSSSSDNATLASRRARGAPRQWWMP